jgi:hypothetical protein
MKLVVSTERQESGGRVFRTVKSLPHTPVPLTPGVGGWRGEGSGLSHDDLDAVVAYLKGTACNVQAFRVELVEECGD